MRTIERLNPEQCDDPPHYHMVLAEYQFARDRMEGLTVADIGCGMGYGAALLAERAKQVIGFDRAAEAITWAQEHYQQPNLKFERADVFSLPQRGETYQGIVMNQFLEHFYAEDQVRLLQMVKEILEPPGVLVVATPNRLLSYTENAYHYRELSHQELEGLLKPLFPQVEMYSVLASERVQAYREKRRAVIRRIYALDPLKLRRRIPRGLWQWVYDVGGPLASRLIARRAGKLALQVSAEDFTIVPGVYPDCVDLVALARL